MSARTSSRSSFDAAHMMAVVPSGPGVLGFAPLASSFSAAARSPRSAAASTESAWPAADATDTDNRIARSTWGPALAGPDRSRISDLRQDAAAVAQLLDRDVVPVEQCDQQVREPRVLRVLHVLPAFDLPVGVAEDRRGQRIVVVPIAVAHVAAEEDRRVI